jgi:hypothetical protein
VGGRGDAGVGELKNSILGVKPIMENITESISSPLVLHLASLGQNQAEDYQSPSQCLLDGVELTFGLTPEEAIYAALVRPQSVLMQ